MVADILTPSLDLLAQEYVLVQAWKKTAHYIRYHNWYSDTLELPAMGTIRPILSVLCLDVRSDALVLRRGAGAAEFGTLLQPNLKARISAAPAWPARSFSR